MGCCSSSPHARRKYRDPADLDEIFVSEEDLQQLLQNQTNHDHPNDTSTIMPQALPLRTFGKYRNNGVFVPDDIDGLPSTRLVAKLASKHNADLVLYQADIDNGQAWRCLRPPWIVALICSPWISWAYSCLTGGGCTCDEMCLWVRKEYSTRRYYRVYANRIEINAPYARIPFGYLGCGSWNTDFVQQHPFDRGAFGFRRVNLAVHYCCCVWPCYGDSVARQRCQCNGPPWGSTRLESAGWWCDEWCCDLFCFSYRYAGLNNGDEVAMASNLALQAYYEGRALDASKMEALLEYWRQHVSQEGNPPQRKRPVLWEGVCQLPCCTGAKCYRSICQCERRIPAQEEHTQELRDVYDKYEGLRKRQSQRYTDFKAPLRLSTCCQMLGCKRCCGRKGCCLCTEGCCPRDNRGLGCCYKDIHQKSTDGDNQHRLFAPFSHKDWDDDHDAARILQQVLGNPPLNVQYKRWVHDEATGEYRVQVVSGAATATAATTATAPTAAAATTGDNEKENTTKNSMEGD